MGLSQATTAVMVFLSGLLPASCHKTSAPAAKSPPPAAVATTNAAGVKILQQNLGELSLTNKSELCLQFNTGELCTFNPKILDRDNIRITLTVESKNEYGEIRDFNVKQLVTKQGA